jgi:AcrR family transcriptional regulator
LEGQPISNSRTASRADSRCATSVFTQGFATADVQEIANKTGVGKGTIYRYFPSKEELFLAAVDHG